jgi:hypothetical protein
MLHGFTSKIAWRDEHFCCTKGYSVTSAGNERSVPKRQNPRRGKGFGSVRRQSSSTDKVEAAGIEPPRDCGVSDDPLCDCVNGQHPRAAHALQFLRANRQGSSSPDTHCQSVHLPPAVTRIAESWDILPPHVREAIQTLVDAAGAMGCEGTQSVVSDSDSERRVKVARRLAQECRHIVQGCLREEEWQDGDREFFDVIRPALES